MGPGQSQNFGPTVIECVLGTGTRFIRWKVYLLTLVWRWRVSTGAGQWAGTEGGLSVNWVLMSEVPESLRGCSASESVNLSIGCQSASESVKPSVGCSPASDLVKPLIACCSAMVGVAWHLVRRNSQISREKCTLTPA